MLGDYNSKVKNLSVQSDKCSMRKKVTDFINRVGGTKRMHFNSQINLDSLIDQLFKEKQFERKMSGIIDPVQHLRMNSSDSETIIDQSTKIDLIILEEEDLVDIVQIFIGFRDNLLKNDNK